MRRKSGELFLQNIVSWGASAIIGVIAIVLNFCGAIVSVLIK
jgi:hypothetical protein